MKLVVDTKQSYNHETKMWEGPTGERTIEVRDPPEVGMIVLAKLAGGAHTHFTFNWEGEIKSKWVRWQGYLPPDDYQANLYVDSKNVERVPFTIYERHDPAPEFDYEDAWLAMAPVILQYAQMLQEPDNLDGVIKGTFLRPQEVGKRLEGHFNTISRRAQK